VAQLIDAATDAHLWAETYDRELTDIFAIQTDVALQIVAALRAELPSAERMRIGSAPTRNLDAYQLYLQGRHAFARYTADGYRQAIDFFERALAQDPDLALAHVGLARADAEDPNEGFLALTPGQAFARAKEAVAKAIALDHDLGEAHGIVALLKFVCDYDWAGSEKEFVLALELSPGSADIPDHYGWLCSALERYDDALRLFERARELDPLSHSSDLASLHLRAGRYEEARQQGVRIVAYEPERARGHSVLGWAQMKLGDHAAGIAALERAVELTSGGTMFLGQLGQAYAIAGRLDAARGVQRQLEELARKQYVSPYHFAYVAAGLGEDEKAIDWLERAVDERAGAVWGIKGSFLFANLRSHPRFTTLLKKMNLA
jgi:serine/threonine-protein kinase